MTEAIPLEAPLLEVNDLKKHFPIHKGVFSKVSGHVYAVDGVSFNISRGETLGLVGESGCGKSTVGRTLLRLLEPTSGSVRMGGEDITHLDGQNLLPYRRRMQMIYQDPYASLNPRMTAGEIVGEPMVVHQLGTPAERREKVASLFERVGLRPEGVDRYPHEFSGGQRQRISIARALSSKPRLLLCDEPTSALDVSVQAQILNLMRDLQREMGLTYLFISHNLAVVRHMADRIAVMYLGRIAEIADADTLFAAPRHPYTRLLLETIPDPLKPKRDREPLAGEVPNPLNPPTGCAFHPRCPFANDRCRKERPELKRARAGAGWAEVACHGVEEGRI